MSKFEETQNLKKGIPPQFEDYVLELFGKGHTIRQIMAMLESTHSVVVSNATVSRFLTKRKAERADITKVVIREQLGKEVGGHLERLEQIRQEVRARAMRCGQMKHTSHYTKLTELEVRVINHLLHYSGADAPDDEKIAQGMRIYLPPEEKLD